jgi:hypothetical protein
MEIRISAKMFAEFVTGGPTKKASTVRKLQRPKSPESKIPSGYYRRAIGIIRAYHDHDNDHSYILNGLKSLYKESETAATPQGKAKWRSNLQAVEAYMKKFASRKWKVISCPRIHYLASDVRISGSPDLAIRDSDRIRLVKLGVRKAKETEEMVRLMLRVIYQAAKSQLKLSPSDITYFDVATGDSITGDYGDKNLEQTIEGGCRALQQMMDPGQPKT